MGRGLSMPVLLSALLLAAGCTPEREPPKPDAAPVE